MSVCVDLVSVCDRVEISYMYVVQQTYEYGTYEAACARARCTGCFLLTYLPESP